MRKNTILAVIIAMLFITGCAQTTTDSQSSPTPQAAEEPADNSADLQQEPEKRAETEESETWLFTDSSGREVELPKNIERIAPSGPLAQIVLFTICPDKLAGFANDITDKQFEYIDQKYKELPVFGNFYGDTLNLESLMAADAQIVIDIGEPKNNIADDMEGIQERTGIPTVFVQMEMDTMVSAYKTLGEITGERAQAEKLAAYIEKTISETEKKASEIPGADRIKVYYGQDDGLTALVSGTVHSDVIDICAGLNVAEVEETVRGGASEISMEQLLLWNPEVVLFAPNSVYATVLERGEWREITAIKNNTYYEVPDGPYNWMGRPPSVNRVLGIRWLSNLLYPEAFEYDMISETKEFYKLFYHCDVTDEQVNTLLANSTLRGSQ